MPKSATTSSLSDYQKLPIKQCKDSLNTNSQALSISYQYHGKAYAYDLAVTRTSCHYGGQRYWWLCPKCKKRVGVLYLAGIFVCRHCIGANYQSQLKQPLDRHYQRVAKIRKRLGWYGGVAMGEYGKPKGMHQTTFNRLVNEHRQLEAQIYSGYQKSVGYMLKSLERTANKLRGSNERPYYAG